MRILVKIYDKCKYDKTSEKINEITLENVSNFFVIPHSGRSTDLEQTLKPEDIDDYHEYVDVIFEDGSRRIFRNSYVDIFKV